MRFALIATLFWLAASNAFGQAVLSLPRYVSEGETRSWYVADSQWGFVQRFNLGLAAKLEDCPETPLDAIAGLTLFPSRFGSESVRGIEALAACDPNIPVPYDEISPQLWDFVTRGAPLPTVMERMRALVFRRDRLTPDYDRSFWNLDQRNYQSTIFTWGPFQAAAGVNCTLRGVLRRIEQNPAARADLHAAFEPEAAALAALQRPGCSEDLPALRAIYDDSERKQRFQEIFADLSASEAVRRAYDDYFIGPENAMQARIIRRYYDIYRAADVRPSEVDFAFILDHALDTTLPPAQAENVRRAATGRRVSNAELRQIISRTFIETMRTPSAISYRRGRDAAFFISDLAPERISQQERADWIAHSRTTPANVGLVDSRRFEPCGLSGVAPCDALWPSGG